MNQEQIKTFSDKASRVAEQHEAMQQAYASESEAKAELLRAVIEAVKPGLPALGSRVPQSYTINGHADCNKQREKTSYFDDIYCGIVVAGEGLQRDNPRDNRGSYEGSHLILSHDGVLYELSYFGDWSKWQGSSWGWEAELAAIDEGEAVDSFNLEEIVSSLSEALDAQLSGNAKKRTKAATERADKLRALAQLL